MFAHGVVQYTADDARLVDECRRVLQPGGRAFFQVYNRISWLNALSKLMKVDLEHVDAPVIRTYTHASFRRLLAGFSDVQLVTERFPVKSRLHGGWKGALFNTCVRRHVQRPPAPMGGTLRLAPDCHLHALTPDLHAA